MKKAWLALLFVLTYGSAGTSTAQIAPDPSGSGRPQPGPVSHPIEGAMKRAGSTSIDLRVLPRARPVRRERPEREPPEILPIELPGGVQQRTAPALSGPSAPAPAPLTSIAGLDFNTWGSGHPPDANGDVGPAYFIETINASIGVYDKATGAQVAAFTFDTLMSQGHFGNLCDSDNFGDPVVVYDTFEDRWVISDFAFKLDHSFNVINPPGAFQCFAVSKSGDPVSGGWNFYSINTAGGLGDYPKFGVWPDGIYMSVNMFPYAVSGAFQNVRLYAFNKAQMYAGAPSVQSVSFDAPAAEFTLLPANARLQTGTPPPGSPNYFSVVAQYLNAVSVYKFHVDWNRISTSTLTGPFIAQTATSWSQFIGTGTIADPNTFAPSPANPLDTLYSRLMAQNQYSNIGGVESLWDSHTVGASGTTSSQAAVRYYQVKVTGGTVEPNATQAFTWSPDATVHRFMPSVAVDRAGNMALGYSASSSSLFPAIRYAGRLSGDPVNTILQTENSLIEGTGSQTITTRWGDYSSMALDPDGCRFWLANEYYNAPSGGNSQSRIGSLKYPGACSPIGDGSVQGTVTATVGGSPISGATVALGSRTTTTNGSGFYAFAAIPAGTYPTMVASATAFDGTTASSIVVDDGSITTQDFSLAAAPTSACPVDTSLADFQRGIPTNVDLTTNAGDVTLLEPANIDQQNTSVSNSGFVFDSTSWFGQTFTAGATGQLAQVDLDLFCSACTGTTPDITVSIRDTSSNLPIGPDLATATIPGFSSPVANFSSAVFSSPLPVTAGTQYAIVVRAVSDPSAGTYAYIYSNASPYAGGRRVTSANSGAMWSGATNDVGFKTYIKTVFVSAGDLISSLKDSNPPSGKVPDWSTLTWTGSAPAGTLLRFQVAGSALPFGPFDFVGPDGSAGSSYAASGGSLSQFGGYRYLRYRAYFLTTNNSVTPTLNDASVCFSALSPPDLSVSNSDGAMTAIPGSSVAYTITATNNGPSGAIGANVADAFPASLTCTWTCSAAGGSKCTATGSGNINDSVNLPNGGSVTYTATCSIAAAATGSLSNTATVTAPAGLTDPTPGNNSATDTDTLAPQANVAITNTDGVTTATPGGSVNYVITASNAGPSDAPGSTVADTFPAALTCTWTCGGSGGGSCTASGSGNISDSADLASGGSVTYDASCSIAASATGSLSNTAIAATAAGVTDPTPGDNSASDTDTLIVAADVALTLTDNRDFVQVGDVLDYIIEVTNPTGPSTAVVTVTDALPVQLDSGTWVCSASGGATCNNGSGDTLSDTATLPVGGKATYTYSATALSAGAGDSLVNSASASLTSGTDGAPGNNSQTDTDIVVIYKDGFEGGQALLTGVNAAGAAYVAVQLRVDAALLDRLSIVPAPVASGRSADGRKLFTLELARFGRDIALRTLTTDVRGASEISPWQNVDMHWHLLEFAWQSASSSGNDGYFAAGSGGSPILIDERGVQDRLTHLLITVENSVPWLIVIEH